MCFFADTITMSSNNTTHEAFGDNPPQGTQEKPSNSVFHQPKTPRSSSTRRMKSSGLVCPGCAWGGERVSLWGWPERSHTAVVSSHY